MAKKSYTQTVEEIGGVLLSIKGLLTNQDGLLTSVLAKQSETNTHLVTLNGNVEQLRKDTDRQQEVLDEHGKKLHEHDVTLAQSDVRGEFMSEDLKEAKTESKALSEKLWMLSERVMALGSKVALILVLLTALAKLVGVDLGL